MGRQPARIRDIHEELTANGTPRMANNTLYLT